jgi:hypothetical protein
VIAGERVLVRVDKVRARRLARLYKDQEGELDRVSVCRDHSDANSAPNTTTFAAA